MNESIIGNLIEILRLTLTQLHVEVKGATDYTDEGFKAALVELIDHIIGGNNGQTEEGESESEQGEEV